MHPPPSSDPLFLLETNCGHQCQLAIPAACWAAGNVFPGVSGLGTFTLSTLLEVVRVLSALIPVKSKDG